MEKFKKLKIREKGITLIALVITIIVLLILAAVSIATLTGDNRNISKGRTIERRNRSKRRIRTSKISSNNRSTRKYNRWNRSK